VDHTLQALRGVHSQQSEKTAAPRPPKERGAAALTRKLRDDGVVNLARLAVCERNGKRVNAN
jgi:hypothetical protein